MRHLLQAVQKGSGKKTYKPSSLPLDIDSFFTLPRLSPKDSKESWPIKTLSTLQQKIVPTKLATPSKKLNISSH